MTRIITYSLKVDAANSDVYHQTISTFADSWKIRTSREIADLVVGFRKYRLSCGEVDRSDAEYAFELLTLGVLLREHAKETSLMPPWARRLMSWLGTLRMRSNRVKNAVKAVRGWAGWFARQSATRERCNDPISQLITWLRANDETVKGKRFEQWHGYIKSNGNQFTESIISRCLEMADKFAESSQEALGKYTEKVERFLATEVSKYCHRYDVRFISQTRLEYHLGMLGTEILNQAYRQRFITTKRKMVIVPPCMSAPEKKCKAIDSPVGAECQACTPTCRINQITKLGKKYDFSVTMIPDDVKVFGRGKETDSIGLVGISCALTNWNGGWETGSLGIPAQGLLLDYVGCKIHWDKEGIPTDTNLKKLQELLGIHGKGTDQKININK